MQQRSITFFVHAVALLIERYNMLYIYTPQFDSGGKVSSFSASLLISHWDSCCVYKASHFVQEPCAALLNGPWHALHLCNLADFMTCGFKDMCCVGCYLSAPELEIWWVGCFLQRGLLVQLWAEVYQQVIAALFFFQIIMIALLAIKKSFAAILVNPPTTPAVDVGPSLQY
jgi:hypothetical protein